MNWHSIIVEGYPKERVRVLAFSALYDDDNAFRILDSQFLTLCRDVTHWAYLEAPDLLRDNPNLPF